MSGVAKEYGAFSLFSMSDLPFSDLPSGLLTGDVVALVRSQFFEM